MSGNAKVRRKICVVTGSRAEYGLLSGLMKEIDSDSELELRIIATGMHLSERFGITYKEIEKDGFRLTEKVDIHLDDDSPAGIAKSIGLGTAGFAEAYARIEPDIVVVLGDRFEILSAVTAALPAAIPVAHIHGGETTEGAFDEQIRHAITKMSHLHFTAAESYRRRVAQMGENPERIFNFGAPGLDKIEKKKFLARDDFSKEIAFDVGETMFLVTYHPETLGGRDQCEALKNLFLALDEFPGARIVITMPNADTGGTLIRAAIQDYARTRSERVKTFDSLGANLYLNAIKHAAVVVGNSSSGLTEAPALKVPTVNIGDRQKGRLRAASVIDCAPDAREIEAAIRKAMSAGFRTVLRDMENPYGTGNASRKIKDVLKTISLDGITMKAFFDITNMEDFNGTGGNRH